MLLVMALLATSTYAEQTSPWTDSSPHRVQFVTVDETVQLEVLDWGGSGRPIVLLAGLGNTAHVYDGFAPLLTRDGHVYGVTRRGYGASNAPASGYAADRLGADVVEVIERLGLTKPIVIGHSIAGQELSFLASRYSDRIAGVIYLDAAYRYAYYRPSVHENLKELRRKLELLDGELSQPLSPAELSQRVHTILGETLTDFEEDLKELMTTPDPPRSPQPGASDLKDITAYQSWSSRVLGYVLPEAELRHMREVAPDGTVGPLRTSPARQMISAGAQRFTDVAAPALAMFASPHDLGPWTHDPSHRSAFETFRRFDEAMTERQARAFERGVEHARVVRLRNASHYLFISHEAEVLREVRSFLASLP